MPVPSIRGNGTSTGTFQTQPEGPSRRSGPSATRSADGSRPSSTSWFRRPEVQASLAGGLLPELLEVLGQTVPGLGRPLLHPRLEHPVAVLHRVEERPHGNGGLAVLLLEPDGVDRDMAGQAHPFERPGDAFGPNDLPELAPEDVLLSLCAPVHDLPGPPWPEVQVALGDLVPARSPPPGHVLARAVGLEHQLARRVEDPGHLDLRVRWCGHHELATASSHPPAPFFVPGAPPGTRPSVRRFPPRTAGRPGPTRPLP